jgi:aspartokinase
MAAAPKDVRVLKFGGSSVATSTLIHQVAKIVKSHYEESPQVVVVVSAMGSSTNELIKLAEEVSPKARTLHQRELDMMISTGERISMSLLSMAIRDLGIEAISLTGSQSGIITSDDHGEAQILEIKGERIGKALDEKKVVIVAGFQGVSRQKEITTLGRGGSDTTALALAAFLKSSQVFMYSDVSAFYSADPKIVPNAVRIDEMPWELGVLSSYFGAKVIHYRAAALAAKSQTEIHLLSTFNPQGKTGHIRRSVRPNIEQFQLFTINLKKGLQKLTTKMHDGLDKKKHSELEGLFSPELIGNFEQKSHASGNGIFVYIDENFSEHQGGKEKFSYAPSEYWSIGLVGTALQKKTSLESDLSQVLATFNRKIESIKSGPFGLIAYFEALETDERPLMQKIHTHFFGESVSK